MVILALPRRSYALLLAGVLSTGGSGAATSVGVAGATVLPSPLSAAVTLYVRTAPGYLCTDSCAAAPLTTAPAARTSQVSLDQDGTVQFTIFGETASNYIVRLDDAAFGGWADRIGPPIVLEPTLNRGGRLSIIVGLAPSDVLAGAFRVVINYN